jgi:hypothetical protein
LAGFVYNKHDSASRFCPLVGVSNKRLTPR